MKNIAMAIIGVFALGLLAAEPVLAQATDVDCDECVDRDDIAQFAVTSAKIKKGSVTGSKIGQFAVSQDKIRQSAVNGSKIASFAVSTDKIRQDAVTASKIAPNAVGITQIDPTQVQQRVSASCPPGTFMTKIGVIGSVNCQPVGTGGDGSAGDLVISGGVSWNSAPPASPNFANITIDPGSILTVPAGTTISCSGDFVNNGTLTVSGGASNNGTSFSTGDTVSMGFSSAAHPGDTPRAANASDWHNDSVANTQVLTRGAGGSAIPRATIITSLKRFRIGGGSGGGILSGANGGGLVIIKCDGAVSNLGVINANGSQGNISTGGGGGGIVVLASATSVDNSAGTINARGGDGGNEQSGCCAPGGGGGGGIVVSVAPTINNIGGAIDVAGGAGVTATGSPSTVARTGGGGGGASGGNGGSGGTGGGSNGDSAAGSAGYSVEITASPATML